MFIPLHTKSDRSPGYGTATVPELLRLVSGFGYGAVALTDIENLYGQIELHALAASHGIKPIPGVELRAGYGRGTVGEKEGRLVLLARDRDGYRSLCRILTRRRGTQSRKTGYPLECLEVAPRGVFYLSDDTTVIQRLLREGVAAEDVRFLLRSPGREAPPAGVLPVADPDMVMAAPADRSLHLLQLAIRLRKRVSDVENLAEPAERVLPSPTELRRLFARSPAALEESVRIADACRFDLDEMGPVFPSVPLPGGLPAPAGLEQLCRARLTEGRGEGRWIGERYDDRLARELSVLRELGFAPYFLVVGEIAARARRTGIEVSGRGSAAASLVAHLLGITSVDPIAHGLYFERFVHRERADLPDIDLDVAADRRDELLDWIFGRFGRERVAMVAAHQTFGRRAAFREGLKALGLPLGRVDQFCERIPPDEPGSEGVSLPLELLPRELRPSVPLIERLIGKLQHLSVHPGGVVITDERIDGYAPLERAPKGVLVTQYDKRGLARLGLVKLDILGNRALTAIHETLALVGRPVPMPDGDARTAAALRAGRTVGCFQVETPALRATLRKLPIRGIADLLAALAIVRPGPASGEAKEAFIRRARGEEAPTPPHPHLAHLLRETHGMMLYEEDLMAAIAALTGWSLERADAARADLVRAAEPVRRSALRREFREASVAHGIAAADAEAFWDIIERFAAYSFNKAHAASYAELAWQTTYLKTHHPTEYACAVLDSYGGAYPLRSVAGDFSRAGVRLLPPHVSRSGERCRLERGAVRVGLSAIKHLRMTSRQRIIASAPFGDVAGLLARVRLRRDELEALVLAGACDGLSPLAPEAYPFVHEALLARLAAGGGVDALEPPRPVEIQPARLEKYQALVRIRNELRYLALHLTSHPMAVLRDDATRSECVTTEALSAHAGEVVQLAGIVAAARRLRTRSGESMQYVTLEDEHGYVEAVLFPAVYALLGDPVGNPGPFLVTGRVEEDRGEVQLVVSGVLPFHQRPRPEAQVNASA